jgi:hypothetical protein
MEMNQSNNHVAIHRLETMCNWDAHRATKVHHFASVLDH